MRQRNELLLADLVKVAAYHRTGHCPLGEVTVVIAAWTVIEQRPAQYYAAFLIMEGLMIGVFSALDGLLFDGMTIAAGGFGLCGIPETLIAELVVARRW